MLTLASFEERSPGFTGSIDLAEQVDSALSSLSTYAELRGVVLKSDLARGIGVRLAPDAMRILASNLIMNAAQHSPSGSEVLVSARLNQSVERPAMFEVKDFGSGISAESLPHVFERFFREDISRSRETGGAGLGLAICKSIVENADGKIEIQSAKNAGTTITVSLPLA
jgi:signal transduction histidine kinase